MINFRGGIGREEFKLSLAGGSRARTAIEMRQIESRKAMGKLLTWCKCPAACA